MTRYPVEKILAKIAEAKANNPFKGQIGENEEELMMIARVGAFELCEIWVRGYILTEQFDEDEEAENVSI